MSKVEKFDALGRFTGSFQDLKQFFGDCEGKWKSVGPAQQLCEENWHGDITWWPDTGDICFRNYPLDDVGIGPSEERRAFLTRKATKWKVRNGDLSLPQMFFQNPLRVIKSYSETKVCMNDPEYKEVIYKSTVIKLPGKKSAKKSIVHRFSPRHEYLGFDLTAHDVPIKRFSGYEFVDDRIDMSLLHYELKDNVSPGGEILARCVMNVFDDVQPRLWDRQGCEEFFNNPACFLS